MMIGEVERRSGLPASCIRYYERIGLLPRATRVSGRRTFDDDVLPRLAAITSAAEAGFSLAEIRALFIESRPGEWRAGVRRKIDDLEAAAKQLQRMKQMLREALACGCFDLELCSRFYGSAAKASPRTLKDR